MLILGAQLNFSFFCDEGWSRAAHWFPPPSVWKDHCGPRAACWAVFRCTRLMFIVCSVVVRIERGAFQDKHAVTPLVSQYKASTEMRVLLWHLSFRFVGCNRPVWSFGNWYGRSSFPSYFEVCGCGRAVSVLLMAEPRWGWSPVDAPGSSDCRWGWILFVFIEL